MKNAAESIFGVTPSPTADQPYDGMLVGASGQTFPPGTPLSSIPAATPYDGRWSVVIQTQRGGPPPAGAAQQPDHGGPGAMPEPDVVDIQLFLDDYKSVDGVMLPHHFTRSIDGKTNEEWTFKTIRINPAFAPDTFAAK